MNRSTSILIVIIAVFLAMSGGLHAQQASMTFFVTSAGSGKGADLGGLTSADQLCQRLGQSAGAGNHTWRAYLSTQAVDGQPAVNATVQALKATYPDGKRVLKPVQTAITNDLGEYRLFWLPPGSYFVSALPYSVDRAFGGPVLLLTSGDATSDHAQGIRIGGFGGAECGCGVLVGGGLLGAG